MPLKTVEYTRRTPAFLGWWTPRRGRGRRRVNRFRTPVHIVTADKVALCGERPPEAPVNPRFFEGHSPTCIRCIFELRYMEDFLKEAAAR